MFLSSLTLDLLGPYVSPCQQCSGCGHTDSRHRDADVIAWLVRAGDSETAIGREFGLTAAAVRQIVYMAAPAAYWAQWVCTTCREPVALMAGEEDCCPGGVTKVKSRRYLEDAERAEPVAVVSDSPGPPASSARASRSMGETVTADRCGA